MFLTVPWSFNRYIASPHLLLLHKTPILVFLHPWLVVSYLCRDTSETHYFLCTIYRQWWGQLIRFPFSKCLKKSLLSKSDQWASSFDISTSFVKMTIRSLLAALFLISDIIYHCLGRERKDIFLALWVHILPYTNSTTS